MTPEELNDKKIERRCRMVDRVGDVIEWLAHGFVALCGIASIWFIIHQMILTYHKVHQ